MTVQAHWYGNWSATPKTSFLMAPLILYLPAGLDGFSPSCFSVALSPVEEVDPGLSDLVVSPCLTLEGLTVVSELLVTFSVFSVFSFGFLSATDFKLKAPNGEVFSSVDCVGDLSGSFVPEGIYRKRWEIDF